MDHAAHQAPAGAHPTTSGEAPAGHDKHAGHSVAMFRDKFWWSLILTVPVLIWSMDPQMWLGYTAPVFPGSTYLPAILGTIVFIYGGLVFLRGAAGELQSRQPGMMTLISLAIVVAFVTSWAGTLGPVRGRDLVGTGHPDHDHAPRALAGDALDRPGAGCPCGTRRAPAGHRRARRRRRDRQRLPVRTAARRHRPGAARRAGPGRRDGCRRHRRPGRIDHHRRIGGGHEGPGRIGDRRSGRRGREPADQGGCRRRRNGAVGDHAPGRRRAGLEVTSPGPRRPGRGDPVLRRVERRPDHPRLLVAVGRRGGRAGPYGNGPGHRVPPRARSRHPVGGRHLHVTRRTQRLAGQGSARPRARPRDRHRDLRQDRDPDQGCARPRGGLVR